MIFSKYLARQFCTCLNGDASLALVIRKYIIACLFEADHSAFTAPLCIVHCSLIHGGGGGEGTKSSAFLSNASEYASSVPLKQAVNKHYAILLTQSMKRDDMHIGA